MKYEAINRSEILKLLQQDQFTREEIWRINTDTSWLNGGQNWNASSYFSSVDACLKLQIPDKYLWELSSKIQGLSDDVCGVRLLNAISPDEPEFETSKLSLSHAMLKAWWLLKASDK